jgi:hypothetical protein
LSNTIALKPVALWPMACELAIKTPRPTLDAEFLLDPTDAEEAFFVAAPAENGSAKVDAIKIDKTGFIHCSPFVKRVSPIFATRQAKQAVLL